MSGATHDVAVEEVEYLRHGDKPYVARLFRPAGEGPFPAVVEAHGGAWVEGNRANNDPINRALARHGIVIAALEFRNPPDATYPGSVADVNYGLRWLKAQSRRFATRPELVGAMGTSSGGHLAVLAGLKPGDPRYAAIPLPAAPNLDARAAYVVSLWPVICPLGRYLALKDKGGAAVTQVRYWLTEQAMDEGSPLQALERGDAVERPHILYLQNPDDPLHPRPLMERFVAAYRASGGSIELELFAGEAYDLPRSRPETPEAKRVIERIAGFIKAEAARAR